MTEAGVSKVSFQLDPKAPRLAHAWGYGQELTVAPAQEPNPSNAANENNNNNNNNGSMFSSSQNDKSVTAVTSAWESLSASTRKLQAEAAEVFVRLTALSTVALESGASKTYPVDVLAASKSYRSVIGAAILSTGDELERASVKASAVDPLDAYNALSAASMANSSSTSTTTTTTETSGSNKLGNPASRLVTQLEDDLARLRVADLLWHLFELFFFDPATSALVGPGLVSWLQSHFTASESLDEIAQSPSPGSHPEYWNSIHRLVLHGRLSEAWDLLSAHPSVASGNPPGWYALLRVLLSSMPSLASAQLSSESDAQGAVPVPVVPLDFMPQWKQWQADVAGLVDQPEVAGEEQVQVLFQILAGQEDALKSTARSWYELLVAEVLYVHPTIKAADLAFRTGAAQAAHPPADPSNSTSLDSIFLAVMNSDVHQALSNASAALGLPWFDAHLTDTLAHAGVLQDYPVGDDPSTPLTLRESVVSTYASESLGSTAGCWQLALTYLLSPAVPVRGRAMAEAIIAREPVTTERKALKLIKVIRSNGLSESLAMSVARTIAGTKVKAGQLGQAIRWFATARDTAALDNIADQLVKATVAGNEDAAGMAALLQGLGSDVGYSDGLAFLMRFCDLQVAMETPSTRRDAAETIRALLGVTQGELPAPRKYLPLVLSCASQLLESEVAGDPISFGMDDVYALMAALEAVQSAHDRSKLLASASLTSDKVAGLRLSLAKALSRAILNRNPYLRG